MLRCIWTVPGQVCAPFDGGLAGHNMCCPSYCFQTMSSMVRDFFAHLHCLKFEIGTVQVHDRDSAYRRIALHAQTTNARVTQASDTVSG